MDTQLVTNIVSKHKYSKSSSAKKSQQCKQDQKSRSVHLNQKDDQKQLIKQNKEAEISSLEENQSEQYNPLQQNEEIGLHEQNDQIDEQQQNQQEQISNNSLRKNVLRSPKNRLTIRENLRKESQEEQVGGFEDGRATKAFFSRFLLIDQAVSIFSLLAIIITVIEYKLEYEERDEQYAIPILWLTTILTICMQVLTVVRYQVKLDWLKQRKAIGKKDNLYKAGYLKYLIIELIISAPHPNPWAWKMQIYFFNEPTLRDDVYYHVNEILTLFLMLRAFLIFRTLIMMSIWYSNRTQRICNLYACDADVLFVIKCIMQNQPYQLISTAMGISILYFSFMIMVCESPLARNLPDGSTPAQNYHNYTNCIWNTIVTMTTVGYGDMFPRTHLGRLTVFFLAIWGVFIVSMMVLTLTVTFETSSMENKSIVVLQRLQLRAKMKTYSAFIITLFAKISIDQQKKNLNPKQRLICQIKLGQNLNKFKMAQRQYRSIQDENISEQMAFQLYEGGYTQIDKELKQFNKAEYCYNATIKVRLELN